MIAPIVSVVIPTRNRPHLLRRCLQAVLEQDTDTEFEVVVVNDGGVSVNGCNGGSRRVTLVQGDGQGPACARNRGIACARGEILLFTDDDAVPEPGWIQAAVIALAAHPEAVGVVGRVESRRIDPLYEHSVHSDGLGNFLTCNVSYRRDALTRTGGFDTGFPFPAAEDRDLGYRMQEIGELRYEPQMVVQHPPRPVGVLEVARQGRFVESEWRLHNRHPQTRPPRWSVRWGPLIGVVRRWQRLLTEERVVQGSWRRALRFAVLACSQSFVALLVTLRGPRSPEHPYPRGMPGQEPGLRLAWIGQEPHRGGGAPGSAWLLLKWLSRSGCRIDCYAVGSHDELRASLASTPRVRLVKVDTGWRCGRWYSNRRLSLLLTGLGSRAWGRRRLIQHLVNQHRRERYDAVVQFSTIEAFGLRRYRDELPALLVHPKTHVAGELRWVRRERALAARCEPLWQRALVESFLAVRTRRQGRDIQLATRVGMTSRKFGEQLVADYAVDPRRLALIRNPIDLDVLRPVSRLRQHGPWRITFVSRMSARNGVELVVELSHRLADMKDEVMLDVVGDHTLWSDYRPLLADLNPSTARYHGPMAWSELTDFLADTDLLLAPAKYEPFGLTVGEALALGVPVVATEAVGAAEDVSPECCTVVRLGDLDAFEAGVRSMLDRLRRGEGPAIARRARAEAERLFAPDAAAACVLETIASAQRQQLAG